MEKNLAAEIAAVADRMPGLSVEIRRIHTLMAEVHEEVNRACAKFPLWPTKLLDAYGVVAEEAGELGKACVQAVYEGGSMDAVREEVVQTAAMCLRFLASMDVYDVSAGPQHEQGLL